MAPHLRSQSAKVRERKIYRTAPDGTVVGVTTGDVVQRAVLERMGIEFDVSDGIRADKRPCDLCGRFFAVPSRPGGPPKTCPSCARPKCLDCDTRLDRPEVQRCKPCSAKASNAPRKKSRPCSDCGCELSRTSRAVRGGGRCWSCEKKRRDAISHCPKGHEYTPENTKMRRGCRACRECMREYARAQYRAKKGAA